MSTSSRLVLAVDRHLGPGRRRNCRRSPGARGSPAAPASSACMAWACCIRPPRSLELVEHQTRWGVAVVGGIFLGAAVAPRRRVGPARRPARPARPYVPHRVELDAGEGLAGSPDQRIARPGCAACRHCWPSAPPAWPLCRRRATPRRSSAGPSTGSATSATLAARSFGRLRLGAESDQRRVRSAPVHMVHQMMDQPGSRRLSNSATDLGEGLGRGQGLRRLPTAAAGWPTARPAQASRAAYPPPPRGGAGGAGRSRGAATRSAAPSASSDGAGQVGGVAQAISAISAARTGEGA